MAELIQIYERDLWIYVLWVL